VKRIQQEV